MTALVSASQGVASAALAPIRSVPASMLVTTNAVTVPSTSASSPAASRAARVIGACVSSSVWASGPAPSDEKVAASLPPKTVIRRAAVAVSVGLATAYVKLSMSEPPGASDWTAAFASFTT